MRKLLTTLLLSLTIISVVGCSSVTKREPRQIPEVKVITEEVRAEIYQPPMPQEVRLEEVRWVVITKDNMNEQIADVEKMLDGDFVVFAMVPSDYENFAWNIQEIRRFIRQQKEIILVKLLKTLIGFPLVKPRLPYQCTEKYGLQNLYQVFMLMQKK